MGHCQILEALACTPWQCLEAAYARDQEILSRTLRLVRLKFRLLREPGICYMGFQSAVPTRSRGHCHTMYFNCFHRSCFPSGLYWPDIFLQMQTLLSNGRTHDIVQIHPLTGAATSMSIGHQGQGVLAFGADGGYINGVTMFALQSMMFFATDIDAPTMPLDLVHDLAAVSVCYTRHASMIHRGVSILRETATRTAFSRPLDPFMLASVVDQLGGPAAACLNEIIKYFNSHFFAQPRLQLSADTAKRIKLLLNPECGT